MIRTEILRAKALRSEISYLCELKNVRKSSEVESKRRAELDLSKKSLWSEMMGISSAPQRSGKREDSSNLVPGYGAQASVNLQRLQQAQEKMLLARKSHKEATDTLSSQLAKTNISRERVTLLQKMIAKSEIAAKSRAESKMSDDLSELVVTNRMLRCSRGVGEDIHYPKSGLSSNINNNPIQQSEVGSGRPSGIIFNTPQIETIGFSNVGELPTLSIKCSLGQQAPLSLSVGREKTGDLKVFIEKGAIRSALGIKTESEIIKARLSALGLKIGSVEIGELDSEGASKGRLRSRVHEDGDQDEIAIS